MAYRMRWRLIVLYVVVAVIVYAMIYYLFFAAPPTAVPAGSGVRGGLYPCGTVRVFRDRPTRSLAVLSQSGPFGAKRNDGYRARSFTHPRSTTPVRTARPTHSRF